ncbi:MAG: redoxin family protein [Dehalococcoidia bacterium]|nr:redoxin family protein [Dehalococcoidia bacterium]
MRPSKRAKTVPSRRRIQRRLLVAIGAMLASAALIGVVVAGYAADDSTTAAPGGTGVSDGQSVGTAGGALVKLASWSGGGSVDLAQPGKPTVVLAMAGWCPTCIGPARDLKAVHAEFGDRVNVIAVSVDPGETEKTLEPLPRSCRQPGVPVGLRQRRGFRVHLRITVPRHRDRPGLGGQPTASERAAIERRAS